MARAVLINDSDNCAVLLTDVTAGEDVDVSGALMNFNVQAKEDIPLGHKIAVKPIAAGMPVLKYGQEIGNALKAIEAGQWIHLHNLASPRGHEGDE